MEITNFENDGIEIIQIKGHLSAENAETLRSKFLELFANQRNFFPVEILVNAKNLTLHAAAKNDNIAVSLANAFAKINTQMERFLNKIQDASIKADPQKKEKIWRASDLREEKDDVDLDGYAYEIEEK